MMDSRRTMELDRVPTGIAGLDTVLQGGLLKGGVYIVQGRPGAGKTILANQMCFNHVAAGGRAAYVTLLAESHTRMLQHLRPLAFFDESAIPDRLYHVSAFKALEDEGLKGLLDLLRQEIRGHRASLLVLDGLVAAEETAGSDRAFRKFVHEVQTHAAMTECTVLLLTSGGPGPVRAEQTMVDGLIDLDDRVFAVRNERSLQVSKFRGSGALRGRHPFRITSGGLVVFPRVEAVFASPSQPDRATRTRMPSGISSQAENIMALRYVEVRARTRRLLSIVKIRDSGFDPALHEFEITGRGIRIIGPFAGYEGMLRGYAQTPETTAPDTAGSPKRRPRQE